MSLNQAIARARPPPWRRGLASLLAIGWVMTGCGEGAHGKETARRASTESYARADREILALMQGGSSWPSYGRDYTNQRYSPLAQITAANVAGLEPAWTYHTGIAQSFEASPVVTNGTMYVSTPLDHVVALDAVSGEKRWEYAQPLETTAVCCGPVNRGVAVYDGRVYLGTLDAKLVALDAASGRKVWEVRVGDNRRGYSITAPPVAAAGKVIVGVAGGEFGIRGFIAAFDAVSGREVWRFYTIPSPQEGGWWGRWSETDPAGTPLHRDLAAERADSARYPDSWKTGGGPVWQAPAIDRHLGLVIFTVGNPSSNFAARERPGDNLYTTAVVAVDLATGKYRWHLQEVPHDQWDLDAASPAVLVEVRDGRGQTVPAVAQAGKTGWVYVIDRRTGRLIRRSEEFVPHENMFTPLGTDTVRMAPGPMGGAEWSAMAYSPQTGYLYVAAMHAPALYLKDEEPLMEGAEWWSGVFAVAATPYGVLAAVDLSTGRVAWRYQVREPLVGGAVATAGGVVLLGTTEQRVVALDARTGAELWSRPAPAAVNAPPITYQVKGRQYVAVVSGGIWLLDSARGDAVLAFALGHP